ncbi:MAG TPA: magnesium transporter CorA family protein [Dinghuibacter sp.]|jgi:magnesium transporter|uniref:magnesium transporter CorA family protein n=1 Tax=Dinghuibacter sp. TaxID=2024697 RepID=UPI002C62E7FF|nr:magnesium transporter CorA family protein [Dinghuibacter sp.]HTJ14162.1 magnesium transporter CorA family protein [Dinghuibacter sp.]
MIQYFKNSGGQTIEIDKPENGIWVNILPPLKQEEFADLSETLDIPIDFLTDSLDIDERSRYETSDNVKLIVLNTPTENNSFNESDAYYITIPICIILTHGQIVTVNSFENGAIKKFLNTFKNRNPDKKNMMVLKVFEKVVQNFMEYLKEANQRRNLLEQKLYQHGKNEDLLQLVRIQKSMVYFVTALRSNETLMAKMVRTNFLQLNEEEKEFLEDLIVDNAQALEMANIYTNILASTMNAFSNILAGDRNSILRWLTATGVVLSLPLLVAVMFCMKIPLPLADSPVAFYVVPLACLAISGSACVFFIRNKYF